MSTYRAIEIDQEVVKKLVAEYVVHKYRLSFATEVVEAALVHQTNGDYQFRYHHQADEPVSQ